MVHFYTYLSLFFDNPQKKIMLKEFASSFNTPHQQIRRNIQSLIDENIILEEKQAKVRLYSLNFEHPLIREFLYIAEKEILRLFLNEHTLFMQLYRLLKPHFTYASILLFGSCTYKKSFNDIDIVIISKQKTVLKKVLDTFEKTYAIKIHAIIVEDVSQFTPVFIAELCKHHMIFNNIEKFYEVLYNEY